MNIPLREHLKTGSTSVCRCWKIARKDGEILGFTDHDEDLVFDGLVFRAGSGLSPGAVAKATGLSVDNTEAFGALESEVLAEDQFASGAFDGAEIVSYLVNWQDVEAREAQFRGHIGEIVRSGGQFRAEVRGLSETLNQSRGRAFQKTCSAVLGDSACGVDLESVGYFSEGVVTARLGDASVKVELEEQHVDRWFERGLLRIGSTGQTISIKRDDGENSDRILTFWHSPAFDIQVGDQITLITGCDRRAETCRKKFHNINNYQGFPDIPGDDWVLRMPSVGQVHDGGSRR